VTSLTNLASGLVPVLKESQFLEKGVLTPDEFVAAGDHLAFKCPTWAWEAGESSKTASWLPPNKQMLATKNVPCMARAVDFAGDVSRGVESTIEDEEGDEGWLLSTPASLQNNSDEHLEEIKDMSCPPPPDPSSSSTAVAEVETAPIEQEDSGDPDDVRFFLCFFIDFLLQDS
jgi:ubiquitin-like-conjugating enzyme ATG3